MTRSVIDVEVVIGNNWRYRGGVGGDGLPESQRPFDGERVRAGGIEVQLAFDVANSSPGYGGAQPENVSLSVFFPSGWRFPIDIQQIPSTRPWLGMRSEASPTLNEVYVRFVPARSGAWMIAANDRKTALATVSGAAIEISAAADLPAGLSTVLATREMFFAVSDAGANSFTSDGLTWLENGNVSDGPPPQSVVAAPVLWGASGRVLIVISRNGGPRGRRIETDLTTSDLGLSGALVNRRASSLNYRAGRWWAVDGGTNRVYWSNDGALWRVLPPLGNDVQAVEVEGE
jgi:hypothetical protein